MNFCRRRFNLYLLLPALWLFGSGCGTLFHHKSEPVALLRIHVESESSTAGSTKSVSVLRSQPVLVNISLDPVLTEADVIAARLIDSRGGDAVEIKFEEIAGWRLEQYSAVNPGKHLVIYAHWGENAAEGRWLAAPIIVRRIANCALVFTPDCSHEEAEALVKGLNVAAKKNIAGKAKD